MTPSRFRAALLVVAITLSACDNADLSGPEVDSDGLASLLAAPSAGAAGGVAERGGNSLFDRLASEIEGFGGLYRTGHCSVAIVLTDLSGAEAAIRLVRAALEPHRACPAGFRLHAVQGQYTYTELQRFLFAATPLFELRGVEGAYVDVKLNRLVIVISGRAVAATVIEALPRVGIPVEAVAFKPAPANSTRSR